MKWTALDAKKEGFRTIIVADCTLGMEEETTEKARAELKEKEVEYMQSSEVETLIGGTTPEK